MVALNSVCLLAWLLGLQISVCLAASMKRRESQQQDSTDLLQLVDPKQASSGAPFVLRGYNSGSVKPLRLSNKPPQGQDTDFSGYQPAAARASLTPTASSASGAVRPASVSGSGKPRNTSGAPFRLRAYGSSRAGSNMGGLRRMYGIENSYDVNDKQEYRLVKVPVKILPAVLRFIEQQKRILSARGTEVV